MAIATKYKIKFTCGHTETKDLGDIPAGKRASRARWMGQNFTCQKCFRKGGEEELAKHNAQLLAEAEVFEQEYDLPELTGSEKQVPWATRVRYELLSQGLELAEGHLDEFLEPARLLTRAGWWIDYKDADADEVLELVTTGAQNLKERSEDQVENENPF